jgi:putative acetyltransferase
MTSHERHSPVEEVITSQADRRVPPSKRRDRRHRQHRGLIRILISGQPLPMFLRRERPADRTAIYAIHAAAFAREDGQVAPEAHLVDGLRDEGDILPACSIVAESGNELVGHVVRSRVTVDGYPLLGLGPLWVLPSQQRRGVGGALMHAVLAAADALDVPAVVVLGDPGYYRRFGFELAAPIGVHPPQPEWAKHFQIRRLTAWTNTIGGMVRYATAFDRL